MILTRNFHARFVRKEDEDGLVSRSTLLKMLRREGVMDLLSDDGVDEILDQIGNGRHDKMISVVSMVRSSSNSPIHLFNFLLLWN